METDALAALELSTEEIRELRDSLKLKSIKN
jgi:hypothetical protein